MAYTASPLVVRKCLPSYPGTREASARRLLLFCSLHGVPTRFTGTFVTAKGAAANGPPVLRLIYLTGCGVGWAGGGSVLKLIGVFFFFSQHG